MKCAKHSQLPALSLLLKMKENIIKCWKFWYLGRSEKGQPGLTGLKGEKGLKGDPGEPFRPIGFQFGTPGINGTKGM